MASLKDTVVSGSLRATDSLLCTTAQFKILNAPTNNGGTTYGPGTSGHVLFSGGSTNGAYWGALPTATTSTKGIMQVGTGLSVSSGIVKINGMNDNNVTDEVKFLTSNGQWVDNRTLGRTWWTPSNFTAFKTIIKNRAKEYYDSTNAIRPISLVHFTLISDKSNDARKLGLFSTAQLEYAGIFAITQSYVSNSNVLNYSEAVLVFWPIGTFSPSSTLTAIPAETLKGFHVVRYNYHQGATNEDLWDFSYNATPWSQNTYSYTIPANGWQTVSNSPIGIKAKYVCPDITGIKDGAGAINYMQVIVGLDNMPRSTYTAEMEAASAAQLGAQLVHGAANGNGETTAFLEIDCYGTIPSIELKITAMIVG